ncbi:hypothetical protein [Streptomyces sp. SID5785]|uniref:hypothetical protein n=1 Tax=Streptomyces sp. SID5785 TaxID=2690309 RepID=UPI0031BB4F59
MHAALELIGSPLVVEGELVVWEGVAEASDTPGAADVAPLARPGDFVRPLDRSGHKIGLLVASGAVGPALRLGAGDGLCMDPADHRTEHQGRGRLVTTSRPDGRRNASPFLC